MLEVKDKDHVRRVRILAKDGVYYIHNDKRFQSYGFTSGPLHELSSRYSYGR